MNQHTHTKQAAERTSNADVSVAAGVAEFTSEPAQTAIDRHDLEMYGELGTPHRERDRIHLSLVSRPCNNDMVSELIRAVDECKRAAHGDGWVHDKNAITLVGELMRDPRTSEGCRRKLLGILTILLSDFGLPRCESLRQLCKTDDPGARAAVTEFALRTPYLTPEGKDILSHAYDGSFLRVQSGGLR
jgi:hypothetical protein